MNFVSLFVIIFNPILVHFIWQQVREKLIQLANQRGDMMELWEERWDQLQLSKYNVWQDV